MNIGSSNHHRMDQAGVLILACMDFHSEIPLVGLLGLVHFRIQLPPIVFGGTGRGDQGGDKDRALWQRHAFLIEMGFDGFKNLLAQPMLLKQVARGQDRGLIRDPVVDQLDAG